MTDAGAANDWWGSLDDARKAGLHAWITGGGHTSMRDPMPGEEPLPPELLPLEFADLPPTSNKEHPRP